MVPPSSSAPPMPSGHTGRWFHSLDPVVIAERWISGREFTVGILQGEALHRRHVPVLPRARELLHGARARLELAQCLGEQAILEGRRSGLSLGQLAKEHGVSRAAIQRVALAFISAAKNAKKPSA